ncbi:2 3-dimethylmalate lyase [Phtheirospermum japonicum]|uniref:2 3-dimethylmalate lyase n=1 Tax=Phtheirospermum japonicum TaxID=374723 RepID=A0A830C165_9LAMI|nr:2 3-dimethylmalate lyase [Phtheirospermum japonicum]
MNISFPSSVCSSRSGYSNHQLPVSTSFDLDNLKTTNYNQVTGKVEANHRHIPFSSTSQGRVSAVSKSAGGDDAFSSPAKSLRRLLGSPGIHLGPACFDALSAKLVERAGFDFCFTTGFGISAARLGLPDTGLISYGEMVDQGRQITAAVSIPIIGDGDNGYGNAMNVKRTAGGYIRAGFAGIIIEDQVSPKACGHTSGRKVVSREESIIRIKAAADARKESGSDIVIVARTDSRQAVSLEESLWRAHAFADAGADVLFIDALASKEEMKAFCEVSPLPKMANMLEGGGRTPILSPIELADVGYKLVAYPLSLLGVSIHAMQDALLAIKGGRIPSPGSMPSFEEIKEILGFNIYYEEEMQYSTKTIQPCIERDYSPRSNSSYIKCSAPDDPEMRNQSTIDPMVEIVIPEIYSNNVAHGSSGPFTGIWSRKLRVKITGRDGFERLDVRIPAGFLEGITNIVPALGGINIKALLDDAALEEGGKQLLDFNDTIGDRIQVFLE